ncbi:hypothetical protein OEA41_003859 [Lepraria neglecta]|uniref:Uncharacterized protein n=1 Tax=Lepraria neglecta TaxID=209136 RepID=A0AAE0DJN3_9LECA|nr:hypothetical protein OEA41_003859 [Lepraria neglecta]
MLTASANQDVNKVTDKSSCIHEVVSDDVRESISFKAATIEGTVDKATGKVSSIHESVSDGAREPTASKTRLTKPTVDKPTVKTSSIHEVVSDNIRALPFFKAAPTKAPKTEHAFNDWNGVSPDNPIAAATGPCLPLRPIFKQNMVKKSPESCFEPGKSSSQSKPMKSRSVLKFPFGCLELLATRMEKSTNSSDKAWQYSLSHLKNVDFVSAWDRVIYLLDTGSIRALS